MLKKDRTSACLGVQQASNKLKTGDKQVCFISLFKENYLKKKPRRVQMYRSTLLQLATVRGSPRRKEHAKLLLKHG